MTFAIIPHDGALRHHEGTYTYGLRMSFNSILTHGLILFLTVVGQERVPDRAIKYA